MTSGTDHVCVVGGGTVGLLAAHVLAARGRRVTVLEAGRRHAGELRSAVRQTGGAHHNGTVEARGFGLGGTSQLWGGQLWAWTREEIAPRPHLALPGWPLDYERDLLPAYRAVADLLPLTADQRELLVHGQAATLTGRPSGRWLTCLSWRSRNFAAIFARSRRRPAFRILDDSVVEGFETADGACTGVRYVDAAGASHVLPVSEVVLAAGTLGNVALLSMLPDGNLRLGEGFMDHLTASVGTFEVVDPRKFRQGAPVAYRRGARFLKRFVPPSDFERQHRLPAGFAQIELDRPEELVALRAFLRACQSRAGLAELVGLVPSLLRGIPSVLAATVSPYVTGREYIAPGTRIQLWVSIEQLPDGENRLVPRNRQVDLRWGHTTADLAALRRYTQHFTEEFDWAPVGLRLVDVRPPEPTDTYHMMGGTRMASHVEDGVVDPRGRVFGYRNLRVAGASVFPTGGVANPTFTACALTWLAVEDMLDDGAGKSGTAEESGTAAVG